MRIGAVSLVSERGDFQAIEKSQLTVHPEYDEGAGFDVAVVYLAESLVFGDRLRPICLPESSDVDVDAYKDDYVRLLGSRFVAI